MDFTENSDGLLFFCISKWAITSGWFFSFSTGMMLPKSAARAKTLHGKAGEVPNRGILSLSEQDST